MLAKLNDTVTLSNHGLKKKKKKLYHIKITFLGNNISCIFLETVGLTVLMLSKFYRASRAFLCCSLFYVYIFTPKN